MSELRWDVMGRLIQVVAASTRREIGEKMTPQVDVEVRDDRKGFRVRMGEADFFVGVDSKYRFPDDVWESGKAVVAASIKKALTEGELDAYGNCPKCGNEWMLLPTPKNATKSP